MKKAFTQLTYNNPSDLKMPDRVYNFFLRKGISPVSVEMLFKAQKSDSVDAFKEEIWNRRHSIESEVENKLIDSCVKSLSLQILRGISRLQLGKARRLTNKNIITKFYKPDDYLLLRIEESVLAYLLKYRYWSLKTALRISGSRIILTSYEIQMILSDLSEYSSTLNGQQLIYSSNLKEEVEYEFPGLIGDPVNYKVISQLKIVEDADSILRLVVIYLNLRSYLIYQTTPNHKQEEIFDLLEKLFLPSIPQHLEDQVWRSGYLKISNNMPIDRVKKVELQEDLQILDHRLHNALLGNINSFEILDEINFIADYFIKIKISLGIWTLTPDEQIVVDYFDNVNKLRLLLNSSFGYIKQEES